MKLLFINRYFYPDITSTPQLLTDLAEELKNEGFEVTFIASQASYTNNNRHLFFEEYKGIKIKRTLSLALGKNNLLFRIIDFLFFYFFASIRILLETRVNIIVSLSNPPFIANLALLLARLKGCKFVYLIYDIYPDVAEELKVIKKGGIVSKFFNKLALISMKEADYIITLGKHMKKNLVKKNLEPSKIYCIDNWANGEKIFPIPKEGNPFISKYGLENKFIIQYSGNMGMGHNFETILVGAKRLIEYKDIIFLFIGDGVRKKEIVKFMKINNLQNILILPYQKREDLLYSLNACDVSLISLRNGLEGLIVPCKIYGIMAAGKPVIFVGNKNCEIVDIIMESKFGFIVPEGNVDEFINSVLTLYKKAYLRKTMGNFARASFENKYERKISIKKYINLFKLLQE